LETKLLKQAKMAGAKTVDGTEMFIRQGAESLRIWGYKPKLDVMRNAVLQELGKTK
jgi:shikimate dehydrogenase